MAIFILLLSICITQDVVRIAQPEVLQEEENEWREDNHSPCCHLSTTSGSTCGTTYFMGIMRIVKKVCFASLCLIVTRVRIRMFQIINQQIMFFFMLVDVDICLGICEYIFVIRDIVYYGVVCQENICSSEVISMILIFFFRSITH